MHTLTWRERLLGMGLVNLATFTWATNITLGRFLRKDVGPITLTALRFLVAGLVFLALLRTLPEAERRPRGDGWLLFGMALAGVVAFVPLLYLGLRFTTAVNATLIAALGPLITGFWAAALLREPMTRRQVLATLLALAGVAWLLLADRPAGWQGLRFNPGDVLILAAVALWGLYSVLSRKVTRHRSALSATALSGLMAVPFLAVAALVEVQFVPVRWTPILLAAVPYLGVAPSVLGFFAWNEGVRRLGPGGAMVFYNTLPVYGALLGTVFLGEAFGPAQAAAAALIIGAGIWAGLGR